ncbi:MAG: hypothetical protein EU549_03470 [Promethearchaeota archaeon]|nr:MAG: hypothetical protein EU549_03470 [Candidatus Lokiarchaeota archaeon]
MISYYDAHCHLTQFKNINRIITKCLENNVDKIIAVAMFKKENEEVLELNKKFSETVIPALGIHPLAISDNTNTEKMYKSIKKLIVENLERVKIIGEIGLDKYFSKDPKIWKKQESIFNDFLTLAEKRGLGVTVHGKSAELEILETLEEYSINPTIIHWYSTDSRKLIKRGIDDGFYYSVNLSSNYSKNVINLIKETPISRLLTESDGPVKYKPLNLIGSPLLIPKVVENIANIKKLNKKEVGSILSDNFKKIMNLEKI